jgi:putative transcriptional regulator
MQKKTKAKKSKLETGLLKGLKEAVAYEEGQINLRTTTIEIPDAPPEFNKTKVKEVRKELNVSQPVFAQMLGVSDGTVKAWETGANEPSGSSARLIQMAEHDPQTFMQMMKSLAE